MGIRMDPRQLFFDDRLRGSCIYCGRVPSTRDHVPSRVLLDEPYPNNLPVVEACRRCNQGFSKDEEYLACFLECVIHGTTTPDKRFRPQVSTILASRPKLRVRIEKSKRTDGSNGLVWHPAAERVEKIVMKLARGHIAYELGNLHLEPPQFMAISPFPLMSAEQQLRFNSSSGEVSGWPEIGSRAFINIGKDRPSAYDSWNNLQDGNYRYSIRQSAGDEVRLVIREYLACIVVW